MACRHDCFWALGSPSDLIRGPRETNLLNGLTSPVVLGLDPRTQSGSSDDGVSARLFLGPRVKPEGDNQKEGPEALTE